MTYKDFEQLSAAVAADKGMVAAGDGIAAIDIVLDKFYDRQGRLQMIDLQMLNNIGYRRLRTLCDRRPLACIDYVIKIIFAPAAYYEMKDCIEDTRIYLCITIGRARSHQDLDQDAVVRQLVWSIDSFQQEYLNIIRDKRHVLKRWRSTIEQY